MSIALARAAFLAAADGRLRLADTGLSLSYSGPAQVLKVSGWRDNGLPFVQVTDPFMGDVAQRAQQLALDIIAAHSGQPSMPAPTPITSLAATLREQLTAAKDRAGRIGESAKSEVANLHTVLDGAEAAVHEVKSAAADIQSALGLSTNGGPPLEKPQA